MDVEIRHANPLLNATMDSILTFAEGEIAKMLLNLDVVGAKHVQAETVAALVALACKYAQRTDQLGIFVTAVDAIMRALDALCDIDNEDDSDENPPAAAPTR